MKNRFEFLAGLFGLASLPNLANSATVIPMREKSNVRMKLEVDGRWSIPGGLAILRGSEKIYRNGLRQYSQIDYSLDISNPHFVKVLVIDSWMVDDILIMDYLY